MGTLSALWLPILLSAVFVFITSSIVHMVLRYHASDYTRLPDEDAVRAAIRSGSPGPAQYILPYCGTMKEMQTPEMQQKFVEGPVAVLNLRRPGPPSMGPSLAQWFIFSLVVSALVAYVASHSLPPDAPGRNIFRVVGVTAFLAYAAGQIPAAIWMGKPWSVAWKEVFDGVLYAAVTAAAFYWLWPR